MIVNFHPISSYPPLPEQRKLIYQANCGDTIVFNGRFYLNNSDPIDYDNSTLRFTLRDHRFSRSVLWTGGWRDGIELTDADEHPGLITIKVPDSVSSVLRRGSYIFSLLITDKATNTSRTELDGMLQIEYAATSPNQDIPYRTWSVPS